MERRHRNRPLKNKIPLCLFSRYRATRSILKSLCFYHRLLLLSLFTSNAFFFFRLPATASRSTPDQLKEKSLSPLATQTQNMGGGGRKRSLENTTESYLEPFRSGYIVFHLRKYTRGTCFIPDTPVYPAAAAACWFESTSSLRLPCSHLDTTTLKSSQSPKQHQNCVLIQLRILFLTGSEWSIEYTTQSFLSVYDHLINSWGPQLVVSKQMASKHRGECRSGFNAPSENPLLWRTHGEKNEKESKMKSESGFSRVCI